MSNQPCKINYPLTVKIVKSLVRNLPREVQESYPACFIVFYFVTSLLDILGKLPEIDAHRLSKYIMKHHVSTPKGAGFVGSMGELMTNDRDEHVGGIVDIAMTYCALICLCSLNADLSLLDRKSILTHVVNLQQADGSFMSACEGNSADLRFTYCAASICSILRGFESINIEDAYKFITDCLTYEGGFGFIPFSEANGGATFCALASLFMLGKLDCFYHDFPNSRKQLVRWLVRRQAVGFNGRPNKDADSCQTFWIGASMHILGCLEFVDVESTSEFLSACICGNGGLSKFPGGSFDLMHTHFSLFGTALLHSPDVSSVCPHLISSENAFKHSLS